MSPALDNDDPPHTEPARPPADDEASRWRRQYGVAIGLLVGFAALVAAMLLVADGDHSVWQRRVYVFGAVEAIVFTAIGWLFGREVNRSGLMSAREDAEAAKQDADTARAAAGQEASRATQASLVAVEAEVKMKAVLAAARTTGGAQARGGPQDVAARQRGEGDMDLRAFIEEMLGLSYRTAAAEAGRDREVEIPEHSQAGVGSGA